MCPVEGRPGSGLCLRAKQQQEEEEEAEAEEQRREGGAETTHLAARSQLKSVNNKREQTANSQIG